MHIRTLTLDDVPAYVAIRREMLRTQPASFSASEDTDIGCDVDKMRARLAEPGQLVVGAFDADCEQGAQPGAPLVGVVGLVRESRPKLAHRALIWGVYVTPKSRGQGVGEALINAAIDLGRGWKGLDSIRLSVVEHGKEAQRLYERCGFVPWGREPGVLKWNGISHDEIHMVRMLR